jgi:hypothetical protein
LQTVTDSSGCSEKGVRLAQKVQVGHAFLWEYSYKTLELAQLLGQLGVILTCAAAVSSMRASVRALGIAGAPNALAEAAGSTLPLAEPPTTSTAPANAGAVERSRSVKAATVHSASPSQLVSARALPPPSIVYQWQPPLL